MKIKLTMLSKVLITVITAVISMSIIYVSLSFFNIKKDMFVLNKRTGKVIIEKGIHFSNWLVSNKYNNAYSELEGGAIIQGKSKKNYGFMYSVIYNYDLKWIAENKSIPETFVVPDYKFRAYILNSTEKLSDEELYDKKHLVEILKYFYEKTLNNSGYIVKEVVITSPIIEVKLPYNITGKNK